MPDQIPTIAEAVAIAQPNDRVLVRPGQYTISQTLLMDTPLVTVESEVLFGAILIMLASSNPLFRVTADSCVIQRFHLHYSADVAVLIDQGADNTILLDNYVFGRGTARGIEDVGAHTIVAGNLIECCTQPFGSHGSGQGAFEGNTVRDNFGGIAIHAPFLVRGNLICDARAGFDTGNSIQGAGIGVSFASGLVVLEGNVIRDNWASGFTPPEQGDLGAQGGGIGIYDSDTVVVIGNRIVRNQATLGGGLYAKDSNVEIRGNTFWANYDSTNYQDNPVRGMAGALFVRNCTGSIEANTIVANRAKLEAGGLLVELSSLEVRGNIVAENWTEGEVGGVFCQLAAPIFSCNDAWSNAGDNYGGNCADPSGFAGNISLDPMFCWPDTGNFLLDVMSPCSAVNSPGSCGLIGAHDVGCGVTEVEDTVEGSLRESLKVFPSPARGVVTFMYVGGDGRWDGDIDVLDASGRRVRRLGRLGSGVARVDWDRRDDGGAEVPGGIYYARSSLEGTGAQGRVVILQ